MAFTFVDVDLEPLEVEPVNKDGVRFYKLPKTDKYYPSVTSITSFKNAAFFKDWRKKIGEDAKIAVRNVRREGNDLLKKLEKEKAISQDEEKASQTNIQQVTDEHIRIIDDLIGTKEKELMSL